MPSNQLIANLAKKHRIEKLEDEEFIVIDVVLAQQQVMNGSHGPLFYPAAEYESSVSLWDNVPITKNHTDQPANEVFKEVGVGRIKAPRYVDNKLKGEAWINSQRLAELCPDVRNKILNGRNVEVSTGLYMDVIDAKGSYDGVNYVGIAKNHKPDHLAILPNEEGACSCQDGCGLGKNSSGVLVHNEQSHNQIYEALDALLNIGKDYDDDDYRYIRDIYEDAVVFMAKGMLYGQGYESGSTEGVLLVGEPRRVVVSYNYTDGQPLVTNTKKESDVADTNKDKLVDDLIGSGSFKSEDKEWLSNLDESQLTSIGALGKTEETTSGVTETSSTGESSVTETESEEPKTVEQYVADAPAEMQEVLNSGLAAHNARKAECIATITKNSKSTFTEDTLKTKPLSELEAIAALAADSEASASTPSSFVGRTGGAPTKNKSSAFPSLGLPKTTKTE